MIRHAGRCLRQLVAGAACALLPCMAPAASLEADLARLLAEERLAGAVVALVDGGQTTLAAAGLADHARGLPMTTTHRVHIGSVTKTALALGVLRLVSQGRAALDSPLATLLPDLRLDNPWHTTSPVRLRHLLDHTAGIEDLRLWQMLSTRNTPNTPLAATFGGSAAMLRVRTEPGRQFSYSNMGYTLAARVLEAVTGERYETWLDRELLRPLGMRDSSFEFVDVVGPRADPRLAMGHHDSLSAAPPMPTAVRPAGQFVTTAADMALLARFTMGDGQVSGQPFITPGLLRAMGHPLGTEAAKAGLRSGYALGLATRERHGVAGLCHDGSMIGYRAMWCLYPEAGKAFFISTNTDSETARYARLDEHLMRALGLTAAHPDGVSAALPAIAAGWYRATPARLETLRYVDELFGIARLSVVGNHLQMQPLGGPARRLHPAGGDLLRADERSMPSHVVLRDADGSTRVSDGLRTWQRVSLVAWVLQATSAALGLAGVLVLLVVLPLRVLWRYEPRRQPALWLLPLLLMPLPVLWLQGLQALGDLSPAGVLLYACSAALPLVVLWQLVWALQRRAGLRRWRWHVLASAAVLQWSAWLATAGLLPLALWR